MGGFGSGKRWSKKNVVEGCYSLDTATMKRWSLLVPGPSDRAGAFHWRRGESSSSVSYLLTVGPSSGTLRLLYSTKSTDANFDYLVRLATTRCHLGGVRWWFVCPLSRNGVACGRRARKLYLSGNYFGCRYCHDLTYTSSQESDARVYAMLRSGLDPGAFGCAERMAATQLGLLLKALTLEENRLERLGKRLGRNRRGGAGEKG